MSTVRPSIAHLSDAKAKILGTTLESCLDKVETANLGSVNHMGITAVLAASFSSITWRQRQTSDESDRARKWPKLKAQPNANSSTDFDKAHRGYFVFLLDFRAYRPPAGQGPNQKGAMVGGERGGR